MYNILTEPLVPYRDPKGNTVQASLPQVYAALATGQVETFLQLRPHQRHAWHAFLVQLAAIAMDKANTREIPEDPGEWLRMIRAITPEFPGDEPWQLVVEDPAMPAFMQAPASSPQKAWQRQPKLKTAETPDVLDIINSSKNHDVKRALIRNPEPGHWLMALVNLQTMAPHIGNGHYPISRLQSGRNSRTAFSLTTSQRHGPHFRRDLTALLEADLSPWPMRRDGIPLMWTVPWDGTQDEALPLSRLHPFYIEICRQRRLVMDGDAIHAVMTTSKARTAAKDRRGDVGDPWQLIDKRQENTRKAMAMQRHSFNYQRISEYLFSPDKWELPPIFAANPEDRLLIARGIKSDQGGTSEGLFERVIPIRAKLAGALRSQQAQEGMAEIADIATSRVKQAGTVQYILLQALATFASAANPNLTQAILKANPDSNPTRRKLQEWTGRLDQVIDAAFFDDIQDEFEAPPERREEIRHSWLINHQRTGIVDIARNILEEATSSIPCQAGVYHKAMQAAQGVFVRQAYDMKRYQDKPSEELQQEQTQEI